MQHFDAGNADSKKPKADPATQAKKEAEQKLYEQHAADLYLASLNKKDKADYWRRLDDIEVTEEKQVPEDGNDPTFAAKVSKKTSPLFFKEGIYENQKGALIKLSKEGKIYLGKGASFEDAIDFALRGQGAIAKGIEYDVGDISMGKRSAAYNNFQKRLANIQKGFDLAEKQGFAFTLSDNTKEFLSLLLENKKISQKEYDAILQREITVELKAQNKQNEFLNQVVEKEIINTSIATAADPAALKTELEKTDPNNKEMDTEAKAVLKHADEKIAKIQQHTDLLQRVADHVDQQVGQLQQQLEDKKKYDGAQNDKTIPEVERDRYKVLSAGIEEGIENNKWLSDPSTQLTNLKHHETNIGNLITNAETTLKVVESALEGNLQTRLQKELETQKGKFDQTDKEARTLLAKIDEYNKAPGNAANKIDIGTTSTKDIQAKLHLTSEPSTETIQAAKDIEKQKTVLDHPLSHKADYDEAKKNFDDFKKNDETTFPNADDRANNKTAQEEHAKLIALKKKITDAIHGEKNDKGEIQKPGLKQKQEKLIEQIENTRKAAEKLSEGYKEEQKQKKSVG